MIGGAEKLLDSLSSEKVFKIMGLSLVVFLVKSMIVQWSYNTIWPRLLENNSVSTRKFKPLTFVEAMVITLLVMALI